MGTPAFEWRDTALAVNNSGLWRAVLDGGVLKIQKNTAAGGDFSTLDDYLAISTAGNVGIGTSSFGTSAATVLGIANGTAPGSSPANMVQLYSEDVSLSAELKVRDEAGNVTTLSPHNFDLIPEGPSEPMAWAFHSERDGKAINVDMLRVVRLVEELTGEKLVYTKGL